MVNSVQKRLGYRDVLYNVKTEKFITNAPGDNYRDLKIQTGEVPSGGTDDRPSEPNVGELFWDTDLDSLVVWDGSSWVPVASDSVEVPTGGSTERPASPGVGALYWDTDLNMLVVWDGSSWVPVAEDDVAILEEIILKDQATDAEIVLSVRDGALIVTNPFLETVSEIDLGGTTPDPGNMAKVSLDGSGRYTTGINANQANNNGLLTLEYINTPGQFFVIEDIDGGVFGPGDRQGFGLVRETIVDRTDLDGALAALGGSNVGGWSWGYFWYYTGGFPYLWTTYVDNRQSPSGSGGSATGAYGGQTSQRQWWDLCGRAGVGKKIRVGIANGTLTQQDGANFSNRLVMQLYVAQEMIDHPDAASLLPATVITNGAGWYTANASSGEYENMGSFPNGIDKGYRFRWSSFGNTTLAQLPYVTGVSNNDQIASAAGLSYYVVYDVDPADKAAANSVLASGVIGDNNRLYPQGTTVDVLQYQNPHDFTAVFANTANAADNVYPLKYTYVAAVVASPLFVNYPLGTVEEIIDAGLAVSPLEQLHQSVCDEVRSAVTAYYLIRDFDAADTALINAKLADPIFAALGGQLINTYDAVSATTADDNAPEGASGDILFPQALKDAILQKLELWMATFPDN